jgi:hypothetical protein
MGKSRYGQQNHIGVWNHFRWICGDRSQPIRLSGDDAGRAEATTRESAAKEIRFF